MGGTIGSGKVATGVAISEGNRNWCGWYWRVATTGTTSRVPYSRYFWSIMRLLEYCERQKEELGRDERIIWKIGKPFLIKATLLASLVAVFAVICPGYTVNQNSICSQISTTS